MNYDVSRGLGFTSDRRDFLLTDRDATAEYVRNQIRIILATFRNQYRFDLNAGVDWPSLLEKGVTLPEVREALREAISRAEYVNKVDRIRTEFEPANRVLSVSFRALLDTGDELISTELI